MWVCGARRRTSLSIYSPRGSIFLNFAKLRLAGLEWLSIPREFPGIGEEKKKHRAQGKAPSLKKTQFFFIATLIKGLQIAMGAERVPVWLEARAFT